jgi:cob(I)alamin adenosyltransferase
MVAIIDKNLESKLAKVDEKEIDFIEKWIDKMDNSLPPLTSFIIPGGHKVVSLCHITRTICRRAERKILFVNQSEMLDPIIIKYVNRLSDLFFVFARKLAFDYDVKTIEADL